MQIFHQEIFSHLEDGPCMSLLSHEQTIGLAFIAQSGLISSVAVLFFFSMVAKNYIRNLANPPPGKWRLIRTHVDAYMLSLMVADLLQAVGAILTSRWAIEQKTYCSAYCIAQGIIQQAGETGVAMSTLAITFHTFFTVFFHFRPPQWVWMVVVAGIWLFLGGFVATSYLTATAAFYAPSPMAIHKVDERSGCWISDGYDNSRLFAEYIWMWSAALINIAFYIPLYFRVRGNITVNPVSRKISFNFIQKKGLTWDMSNQPNSAAIAMHSVVGAGGRNKEALKLIWYPISYTALILPISIARWSSFPYMEIVAVKDLPILRTSITVFIFGLSGLVNVLLFLWTRPHLLLFGPRRGLLQDAPTRLGGAGSPSPSLDSIRSGWPLASKNSINYPESKAPTSATSFRRPVMSSPYHLPMRLPSPNHYHHGMIGARRDVVLQDFSASGSPRIELQRLPKPRFQHSSLQSSFTHENQMESRAGYEQEVEISSAWKPENYTASGDLEEFHRHQRTPDQPLPPPQPLLSKNTAGSRSPQHHESRCDTKEGFGAYGHGHGSGSDEEADLGWYRLHEFFSSQSQHSPRFQSSRFAV
ncbi:hypothetical protein FRB95_002522 [Tulasnella sp. JGI-2019a]|nr:hypothetical protein FRB95_002522 [Tulasnella sp. JGI-2019a]